ncbi:MAG TPA: SAF domain-containing protein, partial [Blastocatellia bacterium]|nr:SAF domain-containing protein [Blastocatellia bacterium]
NILEVHVTFSHECFGPDVPASITTKGLKQLVAGVRFIESALLSPVDKEAMAESLSEMKRVFGKSVVAARDLPAGHCLNIADLAYKKPGTGIPAAFFQKVLGRQLRRAVAADTLLSEEDFE